MIFLRRLIQKIKFMHIIMKCLDVVCQRKIMKKKMYNPPGRCWTTMHFVLYANLFLFGNTFLGFGKEIENTDTKQN